MRETITKLLGISQTSYYRWKEERAIISLLEKYFSEEELKEYLETGKIDKLEQQKIESSKMDTFFLNNAMHKIIESSKLPYEKKEKKSISSSILKSITNPLSNITNEDHTLEKKEKKVFSHPMVYEDEQHALQITSLPINSFLKIFNLSAVKSNTSFLRELGNSKNDISRYKRKILIDFFEYELSELEIDALVANKIAVNKYFENEKLKEVQRLNFDDLEITNKKWLTEDTGDFVPLEN